MSVSNRIYLCYFVSPFNIFLMNKFRLTPALRALIDADAKTCHPLLGYRLPVSVIGRGYRSQSVDVYPEDGYDFFMGCEVARIYQLAKEFDLVVAVKCENSQIYVHITEYLN